MRHELALEGQGGRFKEQGKLDEARHFVAKGLPHEQSKPSLRMAGEAKPRSEEDYMERISRVQAECARVFGR